MNPSRHLVTVLAALTFAGACAGATTDTAATTPRAPVTTVAPPTAPPPAATAPATTTTTTTTAVPTTAEMGECPAWERPRRQGALANPNLPEVSGLAVSRSHPEVLWVHNDSGDAAHVYAIDPGGNLLATHDLTGVDAVDWEDIAIGPGPRLGVNYLYVGDIGNNLAARRTIDVHRFPEPVDPGAAGRVEVETLRLTFPGDPVNAEALLVDPADAAIYVVTKSEEGRSEVYRARGQAAEETLELVAEVELAADGQATAADITADGGLVAIRSYFGVLLWLRPPGTALAEVFAHEPCRGELALEAQGEALGFDPTGGYYTTSEGEGAQLSYVAPG